MHQGRSPITRLLTDNFSYMTIEVNYIKKQHIISDNQYVYSRCIPLKKNKNYVHNLKT